MDKQIIISISREYGCGGPIVAKRLSELLEIPYYDKDILRNAAKQKGTNAEELAQFDEKPKRKFFTRTVRGMTNSQNENVARLQFDYLTSLASMGKSFIVVGRCSDEILKEYPGLIKVFLTGTPKGRVERLMKEFKLNEEEAIRRMTIGNRKRMEYHDYFCKNKWGLAGNYDICINTSYMGHEKTAEYLVDFIKAKSDYQS